ncbi:MAG TPA: hypothetical protein VF636_03970 [Sphingomonas sp.]
MLGTLTTIAAFLAARYARGAFKAAETDLRPWIQFTVEPSWASGHPTGYIAAVVVRVKSIGRTPALEVSCISKTVRWDNQAKDEALLPFFLGNTFTNKDSEPVSLLPGEEYSFQVLSDVPNDDTKRIPTIGVKVGYRWPDGRQARTCRAFHTIYEWGPQEANPSTGAPYYRSTASKFWAAPVNVTE